MMQRVPEPEAMNTPAEAEAYEEADFSEVNRAFAERVVALAGDRAEARVADLGTGPADIPVRLARARPGWRVVGVDAAEAMLALARRRLTGEPGRVGLVLADAKALPFGDHRFDLVVSNSLIHHLNEPEGAWGEVRRVVRRGGVVVFRDLLRPDSPEAARRIVRQYAGGESEVLQRLYYESLLASYTPQEVRAQLASAGLGGLTVEMASDRHWDAYGRVG